LLTSREAETVTDAPDVAARSARRRRIEEPLRRIKRRGFDIESRAIRDAGPRNRLVLAGLIAAG
ncbi:MAG: transposase, partial [Alphaproteobacteria bacterium HGW-Alphaproteobacteria-6]